MIKTFAIKLIDKKEFEAKRQSLLSYVSKEKQERLAKIKNKKVAQRVLFSDIMARSVLCGLLKIENSKLFFRYNENGKPYLRDFDNCYFNISHSGNWIICAISGKEVGADIELVREIKTDIAHRYFSNKECKALDNKTGGAIKSYFFDLWTIKESYLKLVGKGLTQSLNSFTVVKIRNTFKITINNNILNVFIKQYKIDKEYKMAVCAYENRFAGNVIIKTIDEYLNCIIP